VCGLGYRRLKQLCDQLQISTETVSIQISDDVNITSIQIIYQLDFVRTTSVSLYFEISALNLEAS